MKPLLIDPALPRNTRYATTLQYIQTLLTDAQVACVQITQVACGRIAYDKGVVSKPLHRKQANGLIT